MFKVTDKTDRLTKNFSLLEMANKDAGGWLIITPEVVVCAGGFQRFREWLGEAMTVTSWYRTPEYNAKVGGAKDSMHLKALAIDFQTPRHNKAKRFTPAQWQNIIRKWREICLSMGIKGGSVEIAPSWVHLDVRERKDGKLCVMNHADKQPASVYVPADLAGKVTYKYI
jgi:hypothetical protein